jgi:mycothiol S-conjugate amidase
MALRLIAVHAHPDDESSKGAATYAHYLEQGAEVLIVSCTGGERGDVLNALVSRDPKSRRDIAGLRRAEMNAAREIIGFSQAVSLIFRLKFRPKRSFGWCVSSNRTS